MATLNATCLHVRISCGIGWKQTHKNRDKTLELAADASANEDYVNVTQALFENDVANAIKRLQKQTRDGIKRHTLSIPSHDGVYLLPACNFEKIKALELSAQSKLQSLKAELAEQYASLIAEAKAELGDLFVSDVYRDIDSVLNGTAIRVSYSRVPSDRFDDMVDSEGFAEELANEVKQEQAAQVASYTQEIENRLIEAARASTNIVDNYHKSASDSKRFHGAQAIKGLEEQIADCRSLNRPFGVSQISELADKLEACLVPADKLRGKVDGMAFIQSVRTAAGLSVAQIEPESTPEAESVSEDTETPEAVTEASEQPQRPKFTFRRPS